MIKSIKSYEAPKVEVIAVESLGVLCASGGTEMSTFNGNNGGISFGTNNTGSW